MKNNIEMIENILNTERRNRRGNREIRFEVNSNYYKAVSKLLSDYKRVLKENEELNLKYSMLYAGKIENMKAQEVKIKSQVIPVQKVKDILEQKDKIIELMADDIHGTQVECNRYFKDKEDVKQYFKNKAKELLNK